MATETISSGKETPSANGKTRVGLAIQGGVIPAGAFAAGALKGLVDAKAFEKYDIRAFSGTSAGALVAAVCWGHTLKGTSKLIGDDLERQWAYLAWPRHLAWLPVWTPRLGAAWTEIDAFGMKFPLWRLFVAKIRTPFLRWVMTKWAEETIPINDLNTEFKKNYSQASRGDRLGLVLGSADVLRGDIKTFREEDLSLSALLASGSLDEMNGRTTIVTPPHAGTYLDGAWADNPPINELLDYRLNEIWLIQCFPKTIPSLPQKPAERKERRDELWQNSLVEHEREFIEVINRWHDLINGAVRTEIEKLQGEGKLPGSSSIDDKLREYVKGIHDREGQLPKQWARLFDVSNNFQPKHYEEVKIKKIEIMMPRELGSAIVNAPWFIRNLMRLGYQQAKDFAARNFDSVPQKPAGLRPARWALIPSPANDAVYGVKPAHPITDALELVCDFCPRKAASTAGELVLDVLPKPVKGTLLQIDRAICATCPKTLLTKLAA